MIDSALGVGLKARPDSSAVEHLTYKVKGREFELFSLGSVIFPHSLLIISRSLKLYLFLLLNEILETASFLIYFLPFF